MDWQTLFATVRDNHNKVVPIEVTGSCCYVYKTRTTRFTRRRRMVAGEKVVFPATDYSEILNFLEEHGFQADVREYIYA